MQDCEGDCNAAAELDQLQSEVESTRAAIDELAETAGLDLGDEVGLGTAATRVATHLDTELEDLNTYREAEEDEKRELAEQCAEHRLELDEDADEDDLIQYYLDEFGSVDALREHASAIGALASQDAGEADSSSIRANGAKGDDEEPPSTGPGVPETPMWAGQGGR